VAFITPDLRRKVRLKDAKDIELADGLVKLKIAPTAASRALSMAENNDAKKTEAAKVDLFIGSCLRDNGDPLFANQREVVEFLDAISITDAKRLIDEILELAGETKLKENAPGNSDGSPSAS
jgi:hypothetical protein